MARFAVTEACPVEDPPIANLDLLFLVASTTQPSPSTLILDKLSAVAAHKGARCALLITKADQIGRAHV